MLVANKVAVSRRRTNILGVRQPNIFACRTMLSKKRRLSFLRRALRGIRTNTRNGSVKSLADPDDFADDHRINYYERCLQTLNAIALRAKDRTVRRVYNQLYKKKTKKKAYKRDRHYALVQSAKFFAEFVNLYKHKVLSESGSSKRFRRRWWKYALTSVCRTSREKTMRLHSRIRARSRNRRERLAMLRKSARVRWRKHHVISSRRRWSKHTAFGSSRRHNKVRKRNSSRRGGKLLRMHNRRLYSHNTMLFRLSRRARERARSAVALRNYFSSTMRKHTHTRRMRKFKKYLKTRDIRRFHVRKRYRRCKKRKKSKRYMKKRVRSTQKGLRTRAQVHVCVRRDKPYIQKYTHVLYALLSHYNLLREAHSTLYRLRRTSAKRERMLRIANCISQMYRRDRWLLAHKPLRVLRRYFRSSRRRKQKK